MRCRYRAYYYESFPIEAMALLDFSHLNKDGVKTGGMPADEYLALRDDIEKNGLTNPVIIEVDSGPKYRIAMGNNRVQAMLDLGFTTVPAVVLHRATHPEDAHGEFTVIEDVDLLEFMEVIHPGDDTWKKSGWMYEKAKFANSPANIAARAGKVA